MQKKPVLIAAGFATLLAAGIVGMALAERGPGMLGADNGMMGIAAFAILDADKDGKVTEAEVDAHRATQFTAADADKDGRLNADEMVSYHDNAMRARMSERAARMVVQLDTDADGLLTPEEMAAGPRAKSMFERIDADGDGAVTEAEVEAAKTKMAGRMDRHGGRRGGEGHGMMQDDAMLPEN